MELLQTAHLDLLNELDIKRELFAKKLFLTSVQVAGFMQESGNLDLMLRYFLNVFVHTSYHDTFAEFPEALVARLGHEQSERIAEQIRKFITDRRQRFITMYKRASDVMLASVSKVLEAILRHAHMTCAGDIINVLLESLQVRVMESIFHLVLPFVRKPEIRKETIRLGGNRKLVRFAVNCASGNDRLFSSRKFGLMFDILRILRYDSPPSAEYDPLQQCLPRYLEVKEAQPNLVQFCREAGLLGNLPDIPR
jgi:hypothetical protein